MITKEEIVDIARLLVLGGAASQIEAKSMIHDLDAAEAAYVGAAVVEEIRKRYARQRVDPGPDVRRVVDTFRAWSRGKWR